MMAIPRDTQITAAVFAATRDPAEDETSILNIAVKKGYMSPEERDDVVQRATTSTESAVGELSVALGYMSLVQLDDLVNVQRFMRGLGERNYHDEAMRSMGRMKARAARLANDLAELGELARSIAKKVPNG